MEEKLNEQLVTDGVTDGVIDGVTATLRSIEYEIKGWKLKRKIWENPSFFELDLRLGDRVWPAGEARNDYFQLEEIKEAGVKFYPEGAYICSTRTGSKRTFNLDSVIKHPGKQEMPKSKIKHKRKKK